MARRDWLRDCNEQNVPVAEFTQIFCVRCRNNECTRAGYAGSMFAERVSTQVDRLLLNPLFADLSMPQYAQINAMDFPDAVRHALRIEIANKRKDWEMPSEDLDPEAAMKELLGTQAPPPPEAPTAKAQRKFGIEIWEEPEPESDEDQSATTAVAPAPAPSPILTDTPPIKNPPMLIRQANTAFPVGGMMADGSQPVGMTQKPSVPLVDEWAVPTKTENVVPVGAKIRLGLANADANGSKK